VTLRHGRHEQVRLEELPADQRAPVLKAYLKRAPGARPNVAVDKDAPLSEFEPVRAQYPVFLVVPESTAAGVPRKALHRTHAKTDAGERPIAVIRLSRGFAGISVYCLS